MSSAASSEPDHCSPADQRSERCGLGSSILAVDVGGTWIKAAVIDATGHMLGPMDRMPTPRPATPQAALDAMRELSSGMTNFDRVSVAFPGVVRNGRTLTAPNLGNQHWTNFDLASAASRQFGRPVRVLNDAIVHGLGVATGPGLEVIATFGTGLGFALFRDGRFLVQLELGRHIACDSMNYDSYVGHGAFLAEGLEVWRDRVKRTLIAIRNLVNFDRLYLGGGNAQRIDFDLPRDIEIVAITAGVTGGARLWHGDAEVLFAVADETTPSPDVGGSPSATTEGIPPA